MTMLRNYNKLTEPLLLFFCDKSGIFLKLVGQLHWVASQCRPDLCFDILDLSTLLSDASVSNLQSKLNKVLRKTKNNPYKIMFPCLGSLDGIELLLFTDASYIYWIECMCLVQVDI